MRQKKDPDIDQATTKSDFGMAKCNVTHWISFLYVIRGVCVLHFAGNYNTMDGADLWILGVCVLHFVGNYNDAFRAFT